MRGEPEAITALVETRAGIRGDYTIPRSLEDHPVYDTSNYHPFQSVEDVETDSTRCERCGLQRLAVAHLPILVEKRDHGFLRPGGGRFATIEEAHAYIAEQGDSGRHTSFTGRNIDDITYHVNDLSKPAPAPEGHAA